MWTHWKRQQARTRFDGYDTDGNGFLNRDECKV